MKKICTILAFFVYFVAPLISLAAAPPTTPASNITFTIVDGGSLRVNWINGNGARRIVIAREGSAVTAFPANGVDYLADGEFGRGQELAPGQFIVYDGTDNLADVTKLRPATIYYFTIFEYNGINSTTEYITAAPSASRSTLSAPTTQVSNIIISNVTGNSMKLSWTAGNGTKRLVLARQGSSVNANPTDLINYSHGSNFGSGNQIGSGNYVVYHGPANTADLTGLNPNTTYHFSVFEVNGSTTPVYLITNALIASQVTLPTPSVASSNLTFANTDGNNFSLNWTAGNGTKRIVVARAGSAVDVTPVDGVDYIAGPTTSASFATAPEITPGQKVIYDGASSFGAATGLNPGTTYYFKIFEYDGSGSGIAYQTSLFATGSHATVSAPTTQASNITFSNITGTDMRVSWVAGNGSKRIVLAKAGTPVDAVPADLLNYAQGSSFGSGNQIGSGNYVVYNGAGNSVDVSGLVTNQSYHFAVFEANGSANPVFNTTTPARSSQATSDRPTVPASNFTFSSVEGNSMRLDWNSGNGQRRIIIARANAPVDAVPADGMDYLATGFADFNTAPEIAPGQKVVYDGNSFVHNLNGLVTGNTYHYRIYEYTGVGTGITYLTSSFASANKATQVAPTTGPANVNFTNVTGNSMTINWTAGNGNKAVVLLKAGSAVNAVPFIYINPVSSTVFGSGNTAWWR